MKQIMTDYYYSMSDILLGEDGASLCPYPFYYYGNTTDSPLTNLSLYYTDYATGLTKASATIARGSVELTFINSYLLPRFSESFIISSDEELEDKDSVKVVWIYRFIAWINKTKARHTTLYNIETECDYETLMAKLGSTTETKYNDTPMSPDPDTDTHITNYTKNTNSYDSGTQMSRLDEIRRNWESEMELWCEEFAELFIIE